MTAQELQAYLRAWCEQEQRRIAPMRAGFRDGTHSAGYIEGELAFAAKVWLLLAGPLPEPDARSLTEVQARLEGT